AVLTDARGVHPAIAFAAAPVEVHEARVEVPAARHVARRKRAARSRLDVRDPAGEEVGDRLRADSAVLRVARRLVVAETRELLVAEPVHGTQESALVRRAGWVAILPERVECAEPRTERLAI